MLPLMILGSLAFVLAAWLIHSWQRHRGLQIWTLLALIVVSANAIYALSLYVHFSLHPTPSSLPPWKDPETLDFGLLFLSAPLGIVAGIVAGLRGAQKWLIAMLMLASVSLFLLGLLASAAV